jgi:ATP-dependent RNA helicase DHX36
LEANKGADTRVLFCTVGILLRRLVGRTGLGDISHIIVDEVHERDKLADFLLIVLRDILPYRRDLKLILMSATLNAGMFSTYFPGTPTVEIRGSTFPVREYYLEHALEMTGYEARGSQNVGNETKDGSSFGGRGGRGGARGGRGGRGGAVETKFRGYDKGGALRAAPGNLGIVKESPTLQTYIDLYGDSGGGKSKGSRETFSMKTIKSLVKLEEEDQLDANLVAEVAAHICDKMGEGAILIFCPGWQDITDIIEAIESHR